MEYPIFYIHMELYILTKLGYISQFLTRFYFNLSCTERMIFFRIQADRACGTEISPRSFVVSFVILYVCNIIQFRYLTFCHYVSNWQKEISNARMQATESHCHCTSSTSHNKITAGMLERKTESRNGRRNGWMASEPLERAALFISCPRISQVHSHV